MDIKINKDIAKEYPDDSWKGFSLAQLLYIFAAVIAGAAMVCLLYFLLGFNIHIAVYGAFPVAAPIAMVGFYRYAGMGLPEIAKNWLRLKRAGVLPYVAGERPSEQDRVDARTEDQRIRGVFKKKKEPEGMTAQEGQTEKQRKKKGVRKEERTGRKQKKEKGKERQPWDS